MKVEVVDEGGIVTFKVQKRLLATRTLLLASLAATTAALSVAEAQNAAPIPSDTIFAYGPGGPLPAMKQAAEQFSRQSHVQIIVTGGPTPQWLTKARADADVIFSGAEHMMTDFVRQLADTAGGRALGPGRIEESTIEPLYLRPVGILVRPGNPKGIRRFEDLLRPGIKVLWSMALGRSGSGRMWRDELAT